MNANQSIIFLAKMLRSLHVISSLGHLSITYWSVFCCYLLLYHKILASVDVMTASLMRKRQCDVLTDFFARNNNLKKTQRYNKANDTTVNETMKRSIITAAAPVVLLITNRFVGF